VIPEEGRPGGVGPRRARQGAQVSGDAALGNIEAEAKQFPVDAGRAPGVLGGHPPDERSDLERQGSHCYNIKAQDLKHQCCESS
jgi:hypothetical protein